MGDIRSLTLLPLLDKGPYGDRSKVMNIIERLARNEVAAAAVPSLAEGAAILNAMSIGYEKAFPPPPTQNERERSMAYEKTRTLQEMGKYAAGPLVETYKDEKQPLATRQKAAILLACIVHYQNELLKATKERSPKSIPADQAKEIAAILILELRTRSQYSEFNEKYPSTRNRISDDILKALLPLGSEAKKALPYLEQELANLERRTPYKDQLEATIAAINYPEELEPHAKPPPKRDRHR